MQSAFLRHLRKSWPVILIVSLLTLYLEEKGWLRRFETAVLDSVLLLKRSQPASHVVIVGITDDNYRSFFQNTSPLNRERLANLITNIALYKPAVIGVDIDTSDEVFRQMDLSPSLPNIVWAETASPIEEKGHEKTLWDALNPLHEDHVVFMPDGVMGGLGSELNMMTGIAIMPLDYDMHIRHYNREHTVATPSGEKKKDSFHWAIVKRYCESMKDSEECEAVQEHLRENKMESGHVKDLILNLSVEPYRPDARLDAGDFLGAYSDEAASGERLSSAIEGKIVLIGGLYRQGRDVHNTPSGPRSGVELWAQAVESELGGKSLRPVNHFVLMGIEVFAGVFMVFLSSRHKGSLLVRVLDIPFLGLLCIFIFATILSELTYFSLALWANFVPVMVAVYLHLYYDRFQEQKELQEKIERLEALNAALNAALSNKVALYESTPDSLEPSPEEAAGAAPVVAEKEAGEESAEQTPVTAQAEDPAAEKPEPQSEEGRVEHPSPDEQADPPPDLPQAENERNERIEADDETEKLKETEEQQPVPPAAPSQA